MECHLIEVALQFQTKTLVHLKHSKYFPDFCGYERDWAWIVFPWNKREDLVNLIGKILEKEQKAVDVIKTDLKEICNLDIENTEIEEVLEHIRYLDRVRK